MWVQKATKADNLHKEFGRNTETDHLISNH